MAAIKTTVVLLATEATAMRIEVGRHRRQRGTDMDIARTDKAIDKAAMPTGHWADVHTGQGIPSVKRSHSPSTSVSNHNLFYLFTFIMTFITYFF